MKHYWWADWKPEPPYKGKKSLIFGSSPELQKIIDNITANLPEILSSDKKNVIKSKLQEYKKAITELPLLTNELNKTQKALQVWKDNSEEITNIINATKTATEEKLSKETNDDKKKNLQEGIAKLEKLLVEISGLNLAKEELKELIQQRIDDYGWGEDEVNAEFDKKTGDKNWKTIIDEAKGDDFSTTKSNLLKLLAEVIIDYWLTTSFEEAKTRLTVIDNYLKEATETETINVVEEDARKSALSRLRDKCKVIKGTITLTMNGEMNIVDEENKSDGREINFNFTGLTTAFSDTAGIGKVKGIEETNKLNIYYNFADDKDEQDKKFKELKDQLNGYQNRKLVFHFDKLEEGSHKLIRISGKEIHLDYNSYTKVEVSDGTKIPKKPKEWKNIHLDFNNPQLVKNWTDLTFTYEQAKDWVSSLGILPDEQRLVSWLIVVKKGNYAKSEWVSNNADMIKLRKEWLEYEIERRINAYKTKSFDVNAKFEERGSTGHWGSDHRGHTWREYLGKINSLDESAEFGYNAVRGGLLNCLAEVLIPEFILRWKAKTSGRRNMKKDDILAYINQNCSPSENAYYNEKNGAIHKLAPKGENWSTLNTRQIIETKLIN